MDMAGTEPTGLGGGRGWPVYQEEASAGSLCWCWGAVRAPLRPQLSHSASEAQSPQCLPGPPLTTCFQLKKAPVQPACLSSMLVDLGLGVGGEIGGGGSEGCSRRSLSDLLWGSESGRGPFHLHNGIADGTESQVPSWAQVDPPLQAGARLRGLGLRASLLQPFCFHGNPCPLAGTEPLPTPPQHCQWEGNVTLS